MDFYGFNISAHQQYSTGGMYLKFEPLYVVLTNDSP
jgi:hypothetical protein